MSTKIGRNDPCPCKSGKKYKSCCGHPSKIQTPGKRKFSAVWINNPEKAKEQGDTHEAQPINIMERTYGHLMSSPHAQPESPQPEDSKE